MIGARLRRHLMIDQPARRLEVEHRDLRLQQRGVHPLPLAGALALDQREQDPLREIHAGGEVGDRDAHAHRSLPGQSGDRHQTAHALRDLVDPGPVAIRSGLTAT